MNPEIVAFSRPHRTAATAPRSATAQDVTIGHLVRVLLAREVERGLHAGKSGEMDNRFITALHTLLSRDMTEALGWADLSERLAVHGFGLRPTGDDVTLFKTSCGTRLCTVSDLGFSHQSLARRFGTETSGRHAAVPEAHDDTPYGYADCLTEAQKKLIQDSLEPIFTAAEDWDGLIHRLSRCGYVLRSSGSDLIIHIEQDGTPVGRTDRVGFAYCDLVEKFGCPKPGHP